MNKTIKHVRVLLFATLRDYVGSRSLDFDIPQETTVDGLTDILVKSYPRLETVRDTMVTAINRVYAAGDMVIPEDAEIAFFPPVSGG